MKNSAFIKLDGEADSAYRDIYTNYGVSFVKGSYLTLIMKSASKGYVQNNSRLSHGVQLLASSGYAKYNSRTLSLTLLMEASTVAQFVTRLENFTDLLNSGLFFLKVPSKKRVFKLVYSNLKPKQEFKNNKATFTLDLMEPNPQDRVVLT